MPDVPFQGDHRSLDRLMESRDPSLLPPTRAPKPQPAALGVRAPWRPPAVLRYGSLRHLVRGGSGTVGDPAPGFIGKRKMT